MVNKVSPVICIADFKGSNKQFKYQIELQDRTSVKGYRSFNMILEEAKNKLNGACKL